MGGGFSVSSRINFRYYTMSNEIVNSFDKMELVVLWHLWILELLEALSTKEWPEGPDKDVKGMLRNLRLALRIILLRHECMEPQHGLISSLPSHKIHLESGENGQLFSGYHFTHSNRSVYMLSSHLLPT